MKIAKTNDLPFPINGINSIMRIYSNLPPTQKRIAKIAIGIILGLVVVFSLHSCGLSYPLIGVVGLVAFSAYLLYKNAVQFNKKLSPKERNDYRAELLSAGIKNLVDRMQQITNKTKDSTNLSKAQTHLRLANKASDEKNRAQELTQAERYLEATIEAIIKAANEDGADKKLVRLVQELKAAKAAAAGRREFGLQSVV